MTTRSLAHVLGRLGVIEDRIRLLVATRRTTDPAPDDPFRGLYLSDEAVDRLLATPRQHVDWPQTAARLEARELAADDAEETGAVLRLRDLAATFGLDEVDVDLLLIGIAADVDPRFEAFFGYLNDDVSRRRPSAAVALELAGVALTSAAGYAHLIHGPLVTGGLVEVEDRERPFPGRAVRVPDRVVSFLLGDDAPDPALTPVTAAVPDIPWGDPSPLATALGDGVTLAYLREPATGSGRVLAVEALRLTGHRPLVIDLDRLLRQPDPVRLARLAVREARLAGAGIVAGPVSAVKERPDLLQELVADPRPLLLVGEVSWDPLWTTAPPLFVPVPPSTQQETAGGLAVRALRDRRRTRGPRVDRAVPAPAGGRRPRRGVRTGAGDAPGRPPGRSPPPASRRPLGERVRARAPGPADRAGRRLGGPRAATRGPHRAAGGRAAGPAPRPGARRLADAARRRPRRRRRRAVRRRLRHRQDDVGRGHRPRPRPGAVRRRPRHRGRQVRRRDREEPGAHLHGGRRRQRRAALRRGRRRLRQALGGPGRARPLRQRRERLPPAADGVVRRAGDPGDQPAGQHRRGLHPPAGPDGRLPAARRHPPARAVGPLPRYDGAPLPRRRPALPRRLVRARRRLDPLGRRHRRLPRRRRRRGDRHAAPGHRRTAGVPQAGPALPGVGVRRLLELLQEPA